jgi:hypothetical protein
MGCHQLVQGETKPVLLAPCHIGNGKRCSHQLTGYFRGADLCVVDIVTSEAHGTVIF